MRILLAVLFLVIFFLAGVLYGADHLQVENVNELHPDSGIEMNNDDSVEVYENEDINVVPIQSDDTPAYKAASALESVVDFFYDVVVDILVHFSKLFF